MVKKLYTIMLIGCLTLSLIACGKTESISTESRTIKNFVSVANNYEMPIVDACEQYEGHSEFSEVYIAVKTSTDKSKVFWQIEHYTMADENSAINVYDQQIEKAQKTFKKGNVTFSQNTQNWDYAEYTSDSTYFYIERTGNVIILVQSDYKYAEDIKTFVESLETNYQELLLIESKESV